MTDKTRAEPAGGWGPAHSSSLYHWFDEGDVSACGQFTRKRRKLEQGTGRPMDCPRCWTVVIDAAGTVGGDSDRG